MIPLKKFSDYFFENIAIGKAPNQLQITSKCNANCFFCSNNQNPFKIERTEFRSLSEIKKVLWATPNFEEAIQLNDSLPGRLSEGEVLEHPEFFDILKEIRKKFKNVITFRTNGSTLTNEVLKKLSVYLPITIDVSFPTINMSNWVQVFNLDTAKYHIVMNAMASASKHGINLEASNVAMPNWLGWDELEDTYSFLSNIGNTITIWSPGYTNKTKPDVVEKLEYSKKDLSSFLLQMSNKYDFSYRWSQDPYSDLNINHPLLHKEISDSYYKGKRKITWLTSTAAFDRFEQIIYSISRQFPLTNDIQAVQNKTYGGNIESTGLWLLDDIKCFLQQYLKTNAPGVVFIPQNFLDHYGYDLRGDNVMDFFDNFKDINIRLL